MDIRMAPKIMKCKIALFWIIVLLIMNTILSACFKTPNNEDSVVPLSVNPSVKIHIFNGTKEEAIQTARRINIPLQEFGPDKTVINILGTTEGAYAFEARIHGGAPPQGVLHIRGTYENHSDPKDRNGGGIPDARAATLKGNTIIEERPIPMNPDIYLSPTPFHVEIPYQRDKVDRVVIKVPSAGSFGFFLNQVKMEARLEE